MSHVMACPISEELSDRLFNVIEKVRKNPKPGKHTKELVALVHDLSEFGAEYYFLRPVELVGVKPFGKRMVNGGIKAGMSIITKICNKLFTKLNEEQLLHFADYMESLVRVSDEEGVHSGNVRFLEEQTLESIVQRFVDDVTFILEPEEEVEEAV